MDVSSHTFLMGMASKIFFQISAGFVCVCLLGGFFPIPVFFRPWLWMKTNSNWTGKRLHFSRLEQVNSATRIAFASLHSGTPLGLPLDTYYHSAVMFGGYRGIPQLGYHGVAGKSLEQLYAWSCCCSSLHVRIYRMFWIKTVTFLRFYCSDKLN